MTNQLTPTDAPKTVCLGKDDCPTRAATPVGERTPLLGRFAHLGISLPKDDIDEAQREAWAGFPESTGL